MADLSQYVDFSVVLDKSGIAPVIVLADTSSYPAGIQVTGVFSVTQPDGIPIAGNFVVPDINIGSIVVNQCQKELRLAVDGNFQNGYYTITEVVKSDGYQDTVKTKTFLLNYKKATPQITDLTNSFQPSIQVIDGDNTKYAIEGFAVITVIRNWKGIVNNAAGVVAEIDSQSVLLDLNYSGYYYDADYKITLDSIATYLNNNYNWLTVVDVFSNANTPLALSVYTPPTLVQLRNNLVVMKGRIANGSYCGCGCNASPDYSPYNTAQNTFDLFVQNGQNDQNVYTLNNSVIQMQQLFNCSGVQSQKHTYQPIPAYDWGVTPVIVPVTRKPLSFTVGGAMPYAPADGTVDYINPDLAGLIDYAIFSQSDADFLVKNVDFVYNSAGGWSWIKAGRKFVNTENYTIIF